MTDTSQNNKRIAKNTLLLYIRMLFTMLITLYTSRVILKALGVEDFGIYNVVAGIVTFIGFINGTMMTSTSRFITYELGKGNYQKLNLIFNIAFQIHFIIAIAIVIIAETIGLWFVYTHLNIPPEKLPDAIYLYQFSILSLFFSILTVPHSSLIVAHEKMSVYAYITVIDVIMKLLIAWLLMLLDNNRLIYYGLLLMLSQIIQNIIYHIYCTKNYVESKIRKCYNSSIFKEMLTFAGWSVFTSISTILYTQGLNILLNLFFGPIINASRGIAVQVQGAVSRFCVSIQTAFNPQITKSYASNDLEYTRELIVNSSRFSVYLLLFLSISLFTETHFIIDLWLSETPIYVCEFVQIMLAITIVESMCNPMGTAILATGKIRRYQTSVGVLLILIVPISYIFLKLKFLPDIVFKVHLIIMILTLLIRLFLVKRFINMPYKYYFSKCILMIVKPTILTIIIISIYYHILHLPSFVNIIFVHSITFTIICFFGLKPNEKLLLINKIKSFIHNDKTKINC